MFPALRAGRSGDTARISFEVVETVRAV